LRLCLNFWDTKRFSTGNYTKTFSRKLHKNPLLHLLTSVYRWMNLMKIEHHRRKRTEFSCWIGFLRQQISNRISRFCYSWQNYRCWIYHEVWTMNQTWIGIKCVVSYVSSDTDAATSELQNFPCIPLPWGPAFDGYVLIPLSSSIGFPRNDKVKLK
jgi:hypothetical protein